MIVHQDAIVLRRKARADGRIIVQRQITNRLHAAALVPAAEFAASSVPEVTAQIDVAVGGLDKRIAADGIRRGGRRCVGWLSARLGAVEPREHRVVKCRIVAKIADLVVTRVVTLIEHDIRALVEGEV